MGTLWGALFNVMVLVVMLYLLLGVGIGFSAFLRWVSNRVVDLEELRDRRHPGGQ